MKLPKFLLADNSNYPEDIFILHTEFPRFLLNLKDDQIEWFEDVSDENQQDLANQINMLIEQANVFYDDQIKPYE